MPPRSHTPLLPTDPRLEGLSERYVAVLTATGNYIEAAASLGIPVGTFKSRLHRARKKLYGGVTVPPISLSSPSL